MGELSLVRKEAKARFPRERKDRGKTQTEFVVKREINGEFVWLTCALLSMVKMAPEMINRDGDTGASWTPEAWKSISIPTTKTRPSTEPSQLDLWEDSFSCFYFSSHKSHSTQLHSNTDRWNFKCKSKLETQTKNITPWIITDLWVSTTQKGFLFSTKWSVSNKLQLQPLPHSRQQRLTVQYRQQPVGSKIKPQNFLKLVARNINAAYLPTKTKVQS